MNLQVENTMSAYNTNTLLLMPPRHADATQAADLELPALSLDERGMIKDCSKSFEELVGFRRSELAWRHVSMVFPELKDMDLFHDGQINPMLSYLSRCRQQYLVRYLKREEYRRTPNDYLHSIPPLCS